MFSPKGLRFLGEADFVVMLPSSFSQEAQQTLRNIAPEQVQLEQYMDFLRNRMFRQSLLLAGGAEPTSQQVEVLLSSALEACECYFQAFQFVVWSGTSAKDALSSVLFETHGNA